MKMDCIETRTNLLAARRGLLPSEQAEALHTHLQKCESCTRAEASDVELSRALDRLPRRDAPLVLRRRIESRWAPRERRWPRRVGQVAAAAGVALAVAAGTTLFVRAQERSDAMVTEAVNDHLRVLYSEHPVEVESGGIHQVKPWFAGRLDFSPSVAFAGDEDFPLKGGSVAYFMDRKAATFIYGHGLHTVTLFVFRADGLPWPPPVAGESIGSQLLYVRDARGFHVLLWRHGDLGYALVSDASEAALRQLAGRLESADRAVRTR
jgi:anti-sigma factor RsiW